MNTKAASERYQRQVQELSKQAGNANCADCGGRYPRWASWNLGIFLCVNCAGVHRKMGTHISKVKSLTLDTWTKEQVERMREMGNVKNNAKYNPDERRNRPPANVEEGERNSELERFIFDKYKGRFMDVRPPPVPTKDAPRISPNPTGSEVGNQQRRRLTDAAARSADTSSSQNRSATAPFPSSWSDAKRAVTPSAMPSSTSTNSSPVSSLAPPQANVPPRSSSASIQLSRGASNPGNAAASVTPTNGQAAATTTATPSVFDDLLSVQNGGPVSPSLAPPLQMMQPNQQMNPWAHLATQQQAVVSPMVMSHVSPFFQQQYGGGGGGVMGSGTGNLQGASLGAMAFGQQQQQNAAFLSPSDQAHIYLQQSNNGLSPQVMGQQAFGGGGGGGVGNFMSSSSPYGQHIPSSYLGQPSPQPIQQQVPVANSNPFGTFATSMMPAGQQQQYSGGGGRGGMWN